MKNKRRVNFFIPKSLKQELETRVLVDGYNRRNKSKWVIEAINYFLSFNNYPELVNYGDEFQGFDGVQCIVIPDEIGDKLNNAILEVRKKYPLLNGAQSKIIRTAIVQRLL